MKLIFDEVRRLTGPNLLWDEPGAIVDILIEEGDAGAVVDCWHKWMQECLQKFGWDAEQSTHRIHETGVSLAISAPMDALYTACELAELAWHCCAAELSGSEMPDWQLRLQELQTELAEERNPALIKIMEAAEKAGVSCLVDDDELSLGLGNSVQVWPVDQLPDPADIDFSKYTDIPTAFITGTNGKSTSVRLAAEIATAAGYAAGVTSTDFIRVGNAVIDEGDYSGPGGARMLLRDQRTEIAFLEVARGGLLRRGLPIEHVNAALVTNVASDHLGQYGVNNVKALAETKFMVSKALQSKNVLVVNADNELVVEQARFVDKPLCWFSTDENNTLIQHQIRHGGRAVFVRAKRFMYCAHGVFEELLPIDDAPMTFNGTAIHNVQNALGVIGLAKALGISSQAINQGLKSFGSNASDNPGRGNRYRVNDADVIVDFAHNEHSMRAMVQMTKHMQANKRIVMFGHAGDRSDQDIHELTDAVADLGANYYIASELANHLRGRNLGDIPALIKSALMKRGIAEQQLVVADSPMEGAKQAIELAQPGDVILLFVLDERQSVHEWLLEIGTSA